MLFAVDAALIALSIETIQRLSNHVSSACSDFGQTISLKKSQNASSVPNITIGDLSLEAVEELH